MRSLDAVHTLWSVLGDLEATAPDEIKAFLVDWEPIVCATIEAGCIAPLVPGNNHRSMQLVAAAPFLKRSLNDLRAIWIVLGCGYSSQAASIAASLFENALTAAVIASSEARAREAQNTKYAEVPWSAKQLAQHDARRALELQRKNGKTVDQKDFEDSWTINYYHYKWLCQIKHPTWQSVYHDIQSTVSAHREYAVRPGPNNVPDDLQVRASLLGGSVAKTLEAAKAFFLALDGDEGSEEYAAFEERANIAHFGVLSLMKMRHGKRNPVSVLDRSFIKTDFSTLRQYDDL